MNAKCRLLDLGLGIWVGLLLVVCMELLCPVVCEPCWLCAQVGFWGLCKTVQIIDEKYCWYLTMDLFVMQLRSVIRYE